VTGGIAAYKTAALVSSLVQDGCGVTVAMTRSARRFVGATTFRA
jgi:phosphopantothenoylcysteine decarboxylase/phosphopantothenate--cysteine ligase